MIMIMTTNNNLNPGLGADFQIQLLAAIISDPNFGLSVLAQLPSNFFDESYRRMIFESIIKFYKEHNKIPCFDDIKTRVLLDYGSGPDGNTRVDFCNAVLENILRHIKDDELLVVKSYAEEIVKEIMVKRAIEESQLMISQGRKDFNYINNLLSKALSWNIKRSTSFTIFDDLDENMSDNYRQPIPTGLYEAIDAPTNGGPSRGEIFTFLAPLGTGKTTLLTRIANNAYISGHNVLHIFFEDTKTQISRKHYACMTDLAQSELNQNRQYVLEQIKYFEQTLVGKLFLHRLPSVGTTIEDLYNIIKDYKYVKGIDIDMVVLDYIDCLSYERKVKDRLEDEKMVMRKFESMAYEENFVGWTAIQTNRTGINKESFGVDAMGGSIDKAKIAHGIINLARTREQKVANLATIGFGKMRMVRDGMDIVDIHFDNDKLSIGTNYKSAFAFKDDIDPEMINIPIKREENPFVVKDDFKMNYNPLIKEDNNLELYNKNSLDVNSINELI